MDVVDEADSADARLVAAHGVSTVGDVLEEVVCSDRSDGFGVEGESLGDVADDVGGGQDVDGEPAFGGAVIASKINFGVGHVAVP